MARIGAPRVFFNVVGSFQAAKLLDDAASQMTVLNSIFMDGLGGIEDAAVSLAEQMEMVVQATVPLSAEIERATIEFEKFLSVGDEVSGRLAGEIMGIGAEVGFTATESLDAGSRMAQLSGIFNDEVIPSATKMALAFGLIGDMAPEDAMIKLINLQQQTNFVFENTNRAAYDLMTTQQQRLHVEREMARVINQLNSVEDKSAATMSKIIRVMNEFASQARLTGEEISFMAAMSATLIEAGEEQGKAGRALRMIYARLGADTNGAATALNNIGIATKDSTGALRPLSAILADLAPQWETMGNAQKQQIAQAVAGNLHYVRFLKLAEGFGRVTDLQREAVGQTGAVFNEAGEATGFLNDMMESNANQLERARAELEMANAEIGDKLIPNIIEATQFQTQFNLAIADTIDKAGPLGGIMSAMFGFQQKMSTTYAPFFTMNLNIKALMISLATMRQIYRAMDGEMLARDGAEKAGHARRMSQANQINQQHSKQILAYENEKTALQELNITRNMAIGKTRQIGSIQAQIDKRNVAFYERKAKFEKHGIALQTTNIDKLKLSKAATGELKAAILAQANAEDELYAAIERRIAQLPRLIQGEKKYQNTKKDNAIYIYDDADAIRESTERHEERSMALSDETLANAALSNSFMKVGAGVMVTDMLVMGLSSQIDKFAGKGTAARISMVLTGAQMVIMAGETMITAFAIHELSKQQIKQKGTSDAGTVSNTAYAGSLGRVSAAAATAGKAFMRWLPIIAAVGLVLYAVQKRYKIFGDTSKKATKEVENLTDSMNDLESLGTKVKLTSAVDTDAISAAASDIQEFAGAREEMFFGFKAGQVTGDLVKQVSMGGVENFVANTEVVMTNNFNGMTTEEVAQQILNEIERGAKARDINLSGVRM